MDAHAAIFQKKYDEFIVDLRATFPELETELAAAAAIPESERLAAYTASVFGKDRPKNFLLAPGTVLPGVTVVTDLWSSVSEKTCKAVYDYLSILDLCAACESKDGPGAAWAEKAMKDVKEKLGSVDFASLSEKFAKIFGEGGAMPPMPERFLKGKLAKLAEEMVREFKPEDFGFTPEEIASIEADPKRGLEKLLTSAMSNPGKLQETMARVGKRLQERMRKGEIRPAELAAEAEEMMKEFQENPAFVQMMEQFRSAFSFEEPESARASGNYDEYRRNLVKNRLKKKLEERQKNKK
jgi:hypothetical protein